MRRVEVKHPDLVILIQWFIQALKVTQSLLDQTLIFKIFTHHHPHIFFSDDIYMEVDVTWPSGAREEWWGPRNHEQVPYCFLSFGSSFPYLPLRSAQVKLRSLPSGSVTFPRTSLKTQPPLAFDSPVGLPEICLQLIWFPTVVFPAASNLGHLTFLASHDISYLLHPSTLHVETSTYCSCPQEQEASRQLGADLSLTNNDTLPLHIGMATQCWSEHGWLNHYLTISDRHRVKAPWLLAWPFLNHASCIGWKGGQGRQLLCSFLPLTNSPVRQWQALIFLLLIPKNFFQCSRFWSDDGGIAVGEQGEDQKHIGLILPNSFFYWLWHMQWIVFALFLSTQLSVQCIPTGICLNFYWLIVPQN